MSWTMKAIQKTLWRADPKVIRPNRLVPNANRNMNRAAIPSPPLTEPSPI